MHARFESLERRTLMSTWTTVNSGPPELGVDAMAADRAGDIYALDSYSGDVRKSSDSGMSWTTIVDTSSTNLNAIAVDAAGNLFIATSTQILEQPAGQSALSAVDDHGAVSLAIDRAGDVYSAGSFTLTSKNRTSTSYGVVRRRLAGQTAFATVDQIASVTEGAITVVEAGAAAGVYVTGEATGGIWSVRKSADAGQSWATVDQYAHANPSGVKVVNQPMAIVGDSHGNVFVAGYAYVYTLTGYNKNHTPIYHSVDDWVVRKSGDGGISWSTDDDYLLQANTVAYDMGTDLSGNVYVVGTSAASSDNLDHGVIRSNAGGAWQTVDDYQNAEYTAFVEDSSGNLYVGGDQGDGWLIRSSAASTAPVTATATFSSQPAVSAPQHDSLLDLISPKRNLLA